MQNDARFWQVSDLGLIWRLAMVLKVYDHLSLRFTPPKHTKIHKNTHYFAFIDFERP